MDAKELEKEMAKISETCLLGQMSPKMKFVNEDKEVDAFRKAMKDPVAAHVVDITVHDYKKSKAKNFGSFKHRVQVSIISEVQGGHDDVSGSV